MLDAPASLEAMDILQILKSLPHRYPFLLVDRIIEINGDQSCIGIKNVTMNEPHFQGHFPEQPVMSSTRGAVESGVCGQSSPARS